VRHDWEAPCRREHGGDAHEAACAEDHVRPLLTEKSPRLRNANWYTREVERCPPINVPPQLAGLYRPEWHASPLGRISLYAS
jgi:hypothetical protein